MEFEIKLKGKWFGEGMSMLRAAYGMGYMKSDDIGRQNRAYWEVLKHVPVEHVLAAFRQSHTAYPQRLPTAGQMLELARTCAKSKPQQKTEGPIGTWIDIPRSQHAQASYIQEAHSDSEALARIWECESVAAGRGPNSLTPYEDACRRANELVKLITKVFSADKIPQEKCPPPQLKPQIQETLFDRKAAASGERQEVEEEVVDVGF